MFNNSHQHQDEYIREYAFEPELLINREDYLRKEQRLQKSTTSSSTPVRQRWDSVIAKQKEQNRRQSIDPPSDDKNQIEIEIEAFYYVSGPPTTCPCTSTSTSKSNASMATSIGCRDKGLCIGPQRMKDKCKFHPEVQNIDL